LANRTIQQLSPNLGRVNVHCNQCDVEVDSVLQAAREFFVSPGTHTVIGRFANASTRQQSIEVAAGTTENVTLEAPPPVPIQDSQHSPSIVSPPIDRTQGNGTVASVTPRDRNTNEGTRVLHPTVAVVGLAMTAALGSFAIWSWIDAVNLGNQLIKDARDPTSTPYQLDSQRIVVNNAETRTVALDIATGAMGVVTLVTAVFFTRWSGSAHVAVAPSVSARGLAGLSFQGNF
jgi:hypothetical protein